ncbi:MAG: hypothetical protein QF754_00310 [Alphaproteobacteria bacterium]|jgi:hypothetical protein|nr:hypothetical protein [Alphaproteobacteria bacterium]|tara:strand:- start:765 stop:1049 length:285 start_codon:yes stop_codon:yes gene_type:complete
MPGNSMRGMSSNSGEGTRPIGPAAAACLLLALVLMPSPAWAYLDPGTGSIILQVLLGGVGGALVIGRLYWGRIKEFFSRKPPEVQPTADDDRPE